MFLRQLEIRIFLLSQTICSFGNIIVIFLYRMAGLSIRQYFIRVNISTSNILYINIYIYYFVKYYFYYNQKDPRGGKNRDEVKKIKYASHIQHLC